jgi:hypothetical protein
MLAATGLPTDGLDHWVVEPKIDGSPGLPICPVERPS